MRRFVGLWVAVVLAGVFAVAGFAPQAEALTLPPSSPSGLVGMNKNATAVRECPQSKVVVGVRVENRANTSTTSTGIVIRLDLWCATITIAGGVPTVTHDGGLTTFAKVPSSAPGDNAPETVICPAGMVVTGLGGNSVNRQSTWYWPTTAIIVCSPVVVTASGEIRFDTTPANQVTLTAGKPITTSKNRVDGPFCGPSDGSLTTALIRGYRPQAGGEAMDGFIPSCVNRAYDYGDAPATYGDAPAGADGTLQVGALVDAETAPVLYADAGGDDIASGGSPNQRFDDEDAVSVLPEIRIGQDDAVTIETTATNRLDSPATVMAWIDFNQNGTFDAAEATQAVVAAGASLTPTTLSWTGINSLLAGGAGFSYLRVRVSSDPALQPSNAAGIVGTGETEDYRLTFTAAAPSLALTNTPNTPDDVNNNGIFGDAGDTITYTLVATNTGDLPLESVVVNDPLLGGQLTACTPVAPAVLAIGASLTCTGTYTVLQSDVDGGSLTNTATATGATALGATVTSPDAVSTLNVPFLGSLSLTKTSDAPARAPLGTLVTYTITATNNGVLAATDVQVSDPLPGLSALTCAPIAGSTLAPNESQTCTASYTVSQADVDAGSVSNTATVTGTDTQANPLLSSATSAFQTDSFGAATLDVVADPSALASPPQAGGIIAYSFTVTNTGSQTLSGVSVQSAAPGLTPLTYTWPAAPGVLAPGESATATASLPLAQADLDAGEMVLAADVTGTTTSGTAVSAAGSATTPLVRSPGLDIVKSGVVGGTGVAGDTVTYTFVLLNTGNVTMTGFVLEDPLPELTDIVPGVWPGPANTLAPGQSVTYTASYLVSQADVDAGQVDNFINISGIDPDGNQVLTSDSATVPLDARAALAMTSTLTGTGLRALPGAGDTVTVTYTVSNAGTQTLTGVAVTDTMTGLGPLTYSWPGTPGTLVPGQTVTATATVVVDQASIDAGALVSAATVTALDPGGVETTATAGDSLALARSAQISIKEVVNADVISDPPVPGETPTFGIIVVNTGNVTASAIDVTTSLVGLGPLQFTWPQVPGTLLPGQRVIATGLYPLTQADIDAAIVTDTATATGTSPLGPVGPVSATATLTLPAVGALLVEKSAQLLGTGVAGDVIDYEIVVTNTGPLTIDTIVIADPLPGLTALDVGPWPDLEGVLAPGDSVTATAQYTIVAADVTRGAITNTATASGTDSHLGTVSAADSATVATAPLPVVPEIPGSPALPVSPINPANPVYPGPPSLASPYRLPMASSLPSTGASLASLFVATCVTIILGVGLLRARRRA